MTPNLIRRGARAAAEAAGRRADEVQQQSTDDIVLADGGTVRVRALGSDDRQALLDFHQRLSPATVASRYFTGKPRLSKAALDYFTDVDGRHRMGLIALLRADIVALGQYVRFGESEEAEVAFVVDDAHQGRGIAPVLLRRLADVAVPWGITRFVAEMLPENRRMLRVFEQFGSPLETRREEGAVIVRFVLDGKG